MINSLKIEGSNIFAAICTSMFQSQFSNLEITYDDFSIGKKVLSAKPSFLQAIQPFTQKSFNFDLHDKLELNDWIVKGQSWIYNYGKELGSACSFDQSVLLNNLNINKTSNAKEYDFTITFCKKDFERQYSKVLDGIDYNYDQYRKKSDFKSNANETGWNLNIPFNHKTYSHQYRYTKSKNKPYWPENILTDKELNLTFLLYELHPVTVFAHIFLIKLFINYLLKFIFIDEHFIRNYNTYATKLFHGINAYLSAHIVFSQRFEEFYSKHSRQDSSWNELLVESQYKDDGNIFGPNDWNLLAKNLKVK